MLFAGRLSEDQFNTRIPGLLPSPRWGLSPPQSTATAPLSPYLKHKLCIRRVKREGRTREEDATRPGMMKSSHGRSRARECGGPGLEWKLRTSLRVAVNCRAHPAFNSVERPNNSLGCTAETAPEERYGGRWKKERQDDLLQ